jgi:ATP-dependent protease HslVU (ClpYQ) peptidase subunit
MSIIVAVRKGKLAAIASDFSTTFGSIVVPGEMRISPKKIHQVSGAYIGIEGLIAHQTVMKSLIHTKPQLFNLDSADAAAETLRKIHPLLREEYYLLTTEDDDNQEYESSQMSGLIVSKAGVFSFSSHREVAEYKSFWAAGSGIEYGLGALEAIYSSELGPKSIAEIAVRAACKFDSACGLPVDSYELQLES